MRDPLRIPGLGRRGIVFDALAAATFGVVAIFGVAVIGAHPPEQGWFAASAGALIAAAVGCRRISPSTSMLLVVGSAAIQIAADSVAALACLGYAPVFYTYGSHPRKAIRLGSLVAAIIGSVIAGVVLPRVNNFQSPRSAPTVVSMTLFAALTAGFLITSWAFGFISYQRRTTEKARVDAQIAELERRRMLDLFDQEAERNRIARDMHDIVAHSLAVVVAQAEGARYSFDTSPDSARSALRVIADTGRTALSDVRTLLEQLRHTNTAPTDHDQWRESLLARMRAAGMTIDMTEAGDANDASPMVMTTAHRVLTEALTNALKHGDLSKPVVVQQQWDGGFSMTVINRLSGTESALGGTGHGIAGMSERAILAGGRMSAGAHGNGNWVVTAQVPRSGRYDDTWLGA